MNRDFVNLVKYNQDNILQYLKSKNIVISNVENIFSKLKVDLGKKDEYLYAVIDKNDSFHIILSEDIPSADRYKWLNHEMIHCISNNQNTVNSTNIGGIIVEENDIWIGHYLNEAITEYINQQIIKSKYSDYYDLYINELNKIIDVIGEKVVLEAYFTNNLYLIVNELVKKTNYSKKDIIKYIIGIDYLYDEEYENINIYDKLSLKK